MHVLPVEDFPPSTLEGSARCLRELSIRASCESARDRLPEPKLRRFRNSPLLVRVLLVDTSLLSALRVRAASFFLSSSCCDSPGDAVLGAGRGDGFSWLLRTSGLMPPTPRGAGIPTPLGVQGAAVEFEAGSSGSFLDSAFFSLNPPRFICAIMSSRPACGAGKLCDASTFFSLKPSCWICAMRPSTGFPLSEESVGVSATDFSCND
mmetsp:Transcript_34803/g.81534  ORF Transcript_34803/g.81534 Transcript_34803/m.81534 type:complete len:207 (+) Transcript_34803:202-822(+)